MPEALGAPPRRIRMRVRTRSSGSRGAPGPPEPAAPGPALRQALCLAFGTASALGFARFAYGLLLPVMRDDQGWSSAAAGIPATANGSGYLLGALATPLLARRFGTTWVFRGGTVLTAAALAATGSGGDYLLLLLLRAAAGAAGAAVFISGGVLAAHLAVRAGSGTPITVYFAGTGLGVILSGIGLPLTGGNWQLAWFGLGVAAAVATMVSWSAAGEPVPVAPRAGRVRWRALRSTVPAYALFAAGYITYITFLSAYLLGRSASTAEVVGVWGTVGLAVIIGPALWRRPIAHRPGNRVLAGALAALSGGAALTLISSDPAVTLTAAAVYGAMFMTVPAVVTAIVKNHTPAVDWTPTLAFCTAVFAAGQTVGPWAAGALADRLGATAPVWWTVLLCGLGALVAAACPLPDRTTKENEHP
ncbi:YbfB/YjiJ family MFS transporter [Nocardia testacea]|uniref:YbfB/YjiJ family MFS transporter n=1 Tax=Nocardia testacea TaxID=248551 RepID=UPI0002D6746D|nr:YbfB/YjiJ family MFS transporter [Nocardia testacea]